MAVCALVAVTAVGCGSDDEDAAPSTTVAPAVYELIVALRATTEETALAEFDAAQPCLTETFNANYSAEELRVMVDSIRTQDLSAMSDELRRRLRDDALGCNEVNRAVDAEDYRRDAQQRIADEGRTNVQCELPTDISVGATFECTGNFQNRTSEYRATIDDVGHVVIERTDD